MSIDVVVPQVSDGVTSGKVISVAVSVGDQVEADQTLIELETDKAVVAIPSPSAGRVSELKVTEGDTVDVGGVIAVLEGSETGNSAAEADESHEPAAQEKVQETSTDEAEKKSAAKKSGSKPAEQAKVSGKDLVVIGAGPGGYHAAFKAAELGLSVTLIDPEENPGGVCLHRGCIPSKALLHVAKLISEAQESTAIGITFSRPKIDVDRVRAWKNEVVEKLTGGLGAKVAQQKLTYLRGMARFKDAHHLEVTDTDGKTRELGFSQAIVATGSRPIMLPGVETGSQRIIDSTGALNLTDVPSSLLVVGGGYIGLELGSAYAALGSKVSVVEMTDGLLPGCDRDLVSLLKRRLDNIFEDILLKTKVVELKEQKNGVAVTLEGKKGELTNRRFDKVLIAIGRKPNSEQLGLDKTRIEKNDKGFIEVDGQQRTAEPHIFAIGDIAGEPMLAHKAYAEAEVAAEVAAGGKAVYEPRAIPAVVFTDPEIAWCGLTETQAREQKIKVKTAKLPWRGSGRCLTLGRDDGITKLIVDPETDRILGIAVAGPGAGELIAEGVLAMEMAALSEDLRKTIHPHPTLSETLYDAARMLS
ncbi:dihydrolipoyl dehydrogenase [Pelovirga terrestris]|uniref:Dihydrolipoyl dehydrogenase n=1 Tax=Pelovirga terrestris TaxID=2771352 RepID=A0A8J6QSQ8_9BACT|nr:dihydrolipoyl dehydrogenase [Pelovirga terrestris]MBD1401050.1 dihydrolipoyl dehydrogenase [Pelovirga terrestris]